MTMRSRFELMAALLATSVLWSCPGPERKPEVATPVGLSVKCPGHDTTVAIVQVRDSHGLAVTSTRVISAAPFSPLVGVPEANDCQRLIVEAPKSESFGPLAALYAADSLDAILKAVGPNGLPLRAVAAVAMLDGDYAPLRLQQGLNCIYLVQRDSASGDTAIEKGAKKFTARVVMRDDFEGCRKPLERTDLQVAPELHVTARALPPGLAEADLPSVARWADDFRNQGLAHHIWVRCGNLGCDLHPKGQNPPPLSVLPPQARQALRQAMDNHPRARRVLELPGWYDEQRLAVPEVVPGTSGPMKLRPDAIGVFVPHPDLGDRQDADFQEQWVPTGYAYLPVSVPKYREQLNLDAGVSIFYLRRGPLPGVIIERPCTPPTPPDPSDEWWAKVVPVGGDDSKAKYYCVRRHVHELPSGAKFTLPGVVRWQWLEDDEKTWIRCPNGCCPVS